MIIRNRRRSDSLLSRISRSLSRVKPPAGHRRVMSPENFQVEVEKEIQRSNRRSTDPEFAIVFLDFCDYEVPDDKLDHLIDQFEERLRVSDSIGWCNMQLCVLLPETNLKGAELVRASLVEILENEGTRMESAISIYPWDDVLTGNSISYRKAFEKGSNGSDKDGNGFSNSESLQATSFGFSTNSGGVATLPRPTTQSEPIRLAIGSGSKRLFTESQKTPIWKRLIDVTGASFGLVLLSPVLAAAAAAIKLSSKGPVFFRQEREGKDGEVFEILKFRTMCVDAEKKKDDLRVFSEQDGPAFKLKDDPRITKVGKYLRKSCIDELPQLWNVLTGKMSIVGPRPLPVNESHQCLPWQRQRLSVLPGLTCTWQARGSRDTKFTEWMRMDLDYIQNRSLAHDIRLIGETAFVVVLHKGSV